MELFRSDTKIDFVGQTRYCVPFSIALVGASLIGLAVMGFNLGIDFRGGTQLQIEVPQTAQGAVDIGRVRESIARAGFADAEISQFGDADRHEFLVRLNASEAESLGGAAAGANGAQAAEPAGETTDSSGVPVDDADGPDEDGAAAGGAPPAENTPPAAGTGAAADAAAASGAAPAAAAAATAVPALPETGVVPEVQAALTQEFGVPVVFNSIETIGPRVGAEITWSALEALALTSFLILLYIWLRFDLRYAPGAVAALLHDVIIVVGVFVFFRIEFTQQIVAALLVILGYSINDTVVIYDRIRENIATRGKVMVADVVNESLNQTLSRTILTTGFTLIVVISLLAFGGSVLRGFALALLVGMLSGVYSTVYVASAMLVWLEKRAAAKGGKAIAASA